MPVNDATTDRALLLSRRKLAVLAQLLEREGIGLPKSSIKALPPDAGYPLSSAQRRLWFLHQLEPESTAYNVLLAFRLNGVLDVVALERSLNEIVQRHAVLRTRFVVISGEPRQIVQATGPIVVAIVDLSAAANSHEQLATLLDVERERRFDLAQPPLLRASIVRLRQHDQVLLLATHHIVCDRHSTGVFGSELATTYRAIVEGRSPDLPALVIQYGDYAVWERDWLNRERLEPHLTYWRRQLADLPRTELPADRGAAPAERAAGIESLVVPATVVNEIHGLSRRAGVTVFATLVASFQLLLSRYAGQNDVIVGTPVSNRQHHDTEGLIGFFVNTIPLRGDLSGDPPFVDLVRRIGRLCAHAFAHQAVPFDRLVEHVQPARDVSQHPLFDVLVNFDPEPPALQLPGLTITGMDVGEPDARFPITLYARQVEQTLHLRLVYQRHRFRTDRMACMLDQFRHLLEQVVSRPDERVSSYSLVTPRLGTVLQDPRAPLDAPRYEPVTREFRARVEEGGDRIAVRHAGRDWTYFDLGKASRAIAESLVRRGVRGRAVAVTGARSFGLVAAMFGILESGGILLTIDPDLPVERQRVMVRESCAVHLLRAAAAADADLLSGVGITAQRVDPDTGVVIGDTLDDHPAVASLEGDEPAYVFFTSGTTGVPRAVLGSHRGLSHFIAWERRVVGMGPGQRCALITPLSFDPALRDVFLPLTSGATLWLPQTFELAQHDTLLAAFASEEISLVHAVPAVAQHWLSHRPQRLLLSALRHTLFAGEPLTDTLVTRWREIAPNSDVINLYGPTETTLAKCWYVVPTVPTPGVQPVGCAIPDAQAFVVAEPTRLCGAGEVGEIVIRTPFRTLGYLNAADETRRRFRPNPFRDDERDLVFFTGDLGCVGPDGSLEIRGRRDHQVKIRGVRIELDEIAAVLSRHPAVAAAVVCAHEHEPSGKALAAYVTRAPGYDTPPDELRRYLARQMPASHVPSTFTILDRLPLNQNGKVDRQALLTAAPIADASAQPYVPPSTALESVLCELWRDVLKVERVGCEDNFFDLGGHSLLATQIMARVRDVLHVEIPVRTLFETPTIAGLAATIAADPTALERAESIAASRSGERHVEQAAGSSSPSASGGDPVLSPGQRRMWFLSQLDPHGAAFNICKAVHVAGALDRRALASALNAIIARHEVLRTGFTAKDGKPIAVLHETVRVSVRTVDLTGSPEPDRRAELKELIAAEAQTVFDMSVPPLIRAALIRTAVDEHVLLVTVHHLVADGWSMTVLFHDFARFYEAFSTGGTPAVAPLPIQYADFARWQLDALRSDSIGRQLDYWKRQLAGAHAVLDLPGDHRRPAVQTFRGDTRSRAMEPGLSGRVRRLSRREDATPFMTMVAAFAVWLHRRSGESNILIGTPVANRRRLETESLMGFFVNTLVLRVDLDGDPGFRRLLRAVRATTLDAYANQDVPFDRVIEELRLERDVSRTPLFQVMLTFHNTPRPAFALHDLKLTLLDVQTRTSKCDLMLSIVDREPSFELAVEYSIDLFEPSTIESMLDEFEILLNGIVEKPDLPISQFALLSEGARRRLIDAPSVSSVPQECLHELFERQVERTPDGMAVVDNREAVSFLTLNARANQLAFHLRSLGVASDSVVGLCVERSVDMVVGMLGILKAGGAYLPLDAAYPAERLAYMADAAKIHALVTHGRCRDRVPVHSGPLVCLDSDRDTLQRHDCADPHVDVRPDQAAYVIFTSGSTGRPKGICGLHRSAVNRFQWMWRTYPFESGEICGQKTSLSFLDSLWEVLGPLLQGIPIRIIDDETVKDPRRLVASLARAGVTRLVLVPSLLRVLLDVDEASQLHHIRYWTVSGEAMRDDLARRFANRFPGSTLLNLYGSSEVSADVSWSVVSAAGFEPNASIGRPIDNVRMYVLDRHHQPVPVGVAGELYISGVALARGYVGQPALTAEAFVPDPWSSERGTRMYRTGDRCRYRENGELEYLGRADHQVKIRGFRIEPREVEAALEAHPSVEKAVVVARPDAVGAPRLLAYVVAAADGSKRDPRRFRLDLRHQLLGWLPAFMVPSLIVVLDEIPLTPSGKVDRRALPEPSQDGESDEPSRLMPRLGTERAVAEIWRELLGRDAIGVHDNFFDLGGNSLLLMELQSRLQKRFAATVPVVDLFRYATVAAMADRLDDVRPVDDLRAQVARRAERRLTVDRPRPDGSVLHD
jgi:amino acid adenylation domain-containing protein